MNNLKFLFSRRNHQRALESMQASLDAEIKAKAELLKQKKKLESDVNEIEVSLANSNKNNAELQKANKKLQQIISEHQSQLDDQERQKAEIRESAVAADRRSNNLMCELEELRSALEQADRARKAAENDLHDAVDRMNEMNSINTGLVAQKRKLESDLTALRSDLDDSLVDAKNTQDALQKSLADNARQSEEIKFEQVIILIFI
jgi:chromosome segregation ATPase